MKLLFTLFLIAASAIADDNGCFETAADVVPTAGTDDIVLTVLGSFSSETQKLGLDMYDTDQLTCVIATDRNGRQVHSYNTSTGVPINSMNLDSTNTNCFGVAWDHVPMGRQSGYHTNDWMLSTLFYSEDLGASWSYLANPVGDEGRGFDFDGTDYWITNDYLGVCRFQPGGDHQMLATPEIASQLSGLTIFPYLGDIGVAVTAYNSHFIWFYRWNGTDLDYIGKAPCPFTVDSSLGLAYSMNLGTLFWSYKQTDGKYGISELSLQFTSLSRETWAGIKSSF